MVDAFAVTVALAAEDAGQTGWSFDPSKRAYAEWDRITVYRNGALVWGVPPPDYAATDSPTTQAEASSFLTGKPRR